MKIFIFTLFLIFPLMVVQAQEADISAPLQTTAAPVVVELFSSENCPACPPADAFMKTLSASKGVIALSCHVDYFGNTSGNMGRPFCTDRQAEYIARMGRKSHFTPHMMINGHISEVGYETEKISAKLMKARAERVGSVLITQRVAGVYDFTLPSANKRTAAKIWLAVYDKPKTVNERGRSMTYYNVVKRYIPLGEWNGSVLSSAVSPIIDKNSAGFAIVVQDIKSAKVLAAGDFKL